MNHASRDRGNSIEGIAYHEAGHAIVAQVFRAQVVSISIMGDDSSDGRCVIDWDREAHPEHPSAAQISELAGGVAYQVFTGQKQDPGGGADAAEVRRYFESLTSHVGARAIGSGILTHRAEQLVKANWQAIGSLARLLLEHGELSGRALSEAINCAFEERGPVTLRQIILGSLKGGRSR